MTPARALRTATLVAGSFAVGWLYGVTYGYVEGHRDGRDGVDYLLPPDY